MPHFTYQDHLKPEFKELDNAIETGNLAEIKKLVNAQNINTQIDTKFGNTLLIAAVINDQPEIVKYLIEQKADLEIKYNNKYTALNDALNNENLRKIALQLIQSGADIHLPCITDKINALKADDQLRILLENLRKLKESKEDLGSIEKTIATAYEKLGEHESAKNWFLKAAQHDMQSMYQYSLVLIKQNKQKEAASELLKCYSLFTKENEKLDVIAQLEKMEAKDLTSQQNFDIAYLLSKHYLIAEEYKKAEGYLAKVSELNKQFSPTLTPESQKFIQASDILTNAHIEYSQQSLPDEKDIPNNIPPFLFAIQTLGNLAKSGTVEALYLLNSILTVGPRTPKIVSHYYLSLLPSLPEKLKKEYESYAPEFKNKLDGLKALYGLGRKINAAEAIKIFEKITLDPIYNCLAHFYIAAAHVHIANDTSDDEERSERINKAVKNYEMIKKHYSTFSDIVRIEFYRQLFQLLSIAKAQEDKLALIQVLSDFYQTEVEVESVKNEPLLKAVFTRFSKNELLTTDMETWKRIINALNNAHQKTKKTTLKNLFIDQLEELAKISDNLNPKFQFIVKKTLADCYNRQSDKASLQAAIKNYECLEKIATQAEEKFNLKSCRDTYKRLAETIKVTSSDEAIVVFSKAADLGDADAALSAAAVAEEDERQIDTAMQSYEKALREALASNNFSNILSIAKKILAFKDKFDFSSKRILQIQNVVLLIQEKLNDSSFIQSHLEELSTFSTIVKNSLPEEKATQLLATYRRLVEGNKQNAELKKNIEEILLGETVIKNLLSLYEKNVGKNDAVYCEKIKSAIYKYIEDTDIKSEECDDNVEALFIYISNQQDVINLQKELIAFTEKLLIDKQNQRPDRLPNILCNLYTRQCNTTNVALQLAEPENINAVLKKLDIFVKHLSKQNTSTSVKTHIVPHLKEMVEKEKNPILINRIQDILNMIDFKHDSFKMKVKELAQKNYLPAVYELFEKYQKPRMFGPPHARRPLYLAAKIILMTLDKKKAEQRFNLTTQQIDKMILDANHQLKTWAATKLEDHTHQCEVYQYGKQALWYQKVIENAKKILPEDPDTYLLQASLDKYESYNMDVIKTHIIVAMKQGLNADDKWIQQKIDAVIQETDSTLEAKIETTPVAEKTKPVLEPTVLEPSAPLYREISISEPEVITPQITVQASQGLYPSLDDVTMTIEKAASVVVAEMLTPVSIQPEVKKEELNLTVSDIHFIPAVTQQSQLVEHEIEEQPGAATYKLENDKEIQAMFAFFEKPAKQKEEKKPEVKEKVKQKQVIVI